MNTAIVGAVLFGIVCIAIRSMIRERKKGGGCAGCGGCTACRKNGF